jgi:hypothetical protein
MNTAEKIIEDYISGEISGQNQKMHAAVGKINAESNKDLKDAVLVLAKQIPISISELRNTITINVDKLIKSNEDLSKSNTTHARSMNLLTGALVILALIEVIMELYK